MLYGEMTIISGSKGNSKIVPENNSPVLALHAGKTKMRQNFVNTNLNKHKGEEVTRVGYYTGWFEARYMFPWHEAARCISTPLDGMLVH